MKSNNILTNLVRIIAITGLVLSCKGIAVKAIDLNKSEKTVSELKVDKKTEKLKSKNEDYRFWIKVEGTQIDYPVVQSEDNDFYIKRDFNKEESIAGTPFLDYRNNSLNDKNTIIYAHHMRNGSMFGELKKFKNEDFFNQNNKVTVEINGKVNTYEVFSVYVTAGTTDYLKVDFLDNEYQEYLNTAIEKSMYDSKVEVNKDDKIITFSTCSYEFEDARTVVHAKLVK